MYVLKVCFELSKVNVTCAVEVHHLETKLILVFVRTVTEHVHDLGELLKGDGSIPINIENLEHAVCEERVLTLPE